MRRLAFDTGGTFTDIVYIDDDAMQLVVDKVPTTPKDLGQGVLEAIRKIKADMSRIALFIHGTTAGLNTIAQRKGAKVALITTRGFIDILEMTRSSRKEVYDYLWKKPKPLVPRYLRMGVRERINYKGEILEKLDEEDARVVAGRLKDNGAEAIAVCLLHSYANPENEEEFEILKTSGMPLEKGCRVIVIAGGGGGYGSPLERDIEDVRQDVINGYVSIESTRRDYGVMIDPQSLEVDNKAIKELRNSI